MSRTTLHAAAGLGAIAYAFLSAPAALGLAGALVAHNVLLLPRVAPGLMRPAGTRPDAGVVSYPLVVLVATWIFRDRLELAAAVWAILAFGDAAASAIGRRIGRHPLPWNAAKTWEGLLAFVAAGGLAAAITQGFVTAMSGGGANAGARLAWESAVAALAAGLAETLARPWNDNVRIGAASITVLVAVEALAPGGLDRLAAVAGDLSWSGVEVALTACAAVVCGLNIRLC